MDAVESDSGTFEVKGDGNVLHFLKLQMSEYWNICDLLHNHATITTISVTEQKIVLQLKKWSDDRNADENECFQIVTAFLMDFLSFKESVTDENYAWTKYKLEENKSVLTIFENRQFRITGRWNAVVQAVCGIRGIPHYPHFDARQQANLQHRFRSNRLRLTFQAAPRLFCKSLILKSSDEEYKVVAPDQSVARFILFHHETHYQALQNSVCQYTNMTIRKEQGLDKFVYIFTAKDLSELKDNKWNLKQYCEDRLSNFLSKFTSQCKSFNSLHLGNALDKEPSFFKEKPVDKNNPVFVQWRLHDDLVFISGLMNNVDEKIREITEHIQCLLSGLSHNANSCKPIEEMKATSSLLYSGNVDKASKSRSKLKKVFAHFTTAPPYCQSRMKKYHPYDSRQPDLILPLQVQCDECSYGKFKVKLCHGDISLDNSDVIINGCTENFNLDCGTASRAILEKAGPQIQEQCSFRPVQQSTNIRVTNGWNLLCKYVVHVVTPHSPDQLARRLKEALDFAELMKATSVAIPVIISDGFGLYADDIADPFAQALDLFVDTNPSMVKTIKLFSHLKSILPYFEASIIHTQSILNCGENALKAAFADSKNNLKPTADPHKLDIASQEWYVEVVKYFEHAEMQRFTNHDWIEIYQYANERSVYIWFISSCKITLSGTKGEVGLVTVFLQDLVCEVQQSALCEAWKWSITKKRYKRLPPRVGRVIENAFMKMERECHTTLFGSDITVDTVQREFVYQGIRGNLLRCHNDTQDMPPNWDEMNGKLMRKVELCKALPEYETVLKQFKASLPSFSSIIKIERIQNPILHQQYNIRKKDVARHLMSTNPVERELFHGTTDMVTDAICAQGFSRKFCGKHGSVHGQGIYFATTSKYSLAYTDSVGHKCMFLVKVLTGDYCCNNKLNQSMVEPPLKPGADVSYRLYDSVVNHLTKPTIFVVFNDTCVYPMYLITFCT